MFDILLNREHVIVDQLDIYSQVGRAVAHDEVIPFTVKNKQLHVLEQTSYIEGSRIRLDFVKVNLCWPTGTSTLIYISFTTCTANLCSTFQGCML